MKKKVSDYIADFAAENGIKDIFTVVGGGAMHMNDSFGHHKSLHCVYQHHEQACAMAAEAYARVNNRIAAVCVTTGPGATNAVTGVLGGWMDSIPMMIFSGQARFATTVESTGLPLRSMGVQECNIVPVVTPITKYAVMIKDPRTIRYHLEKALYMAKSGRPGPVWIDVPLDVQGAVVETDGMKAFIPEEKTSDVSCASETDTGSDEYAKDHAKDLFQKNKISAKLAGEILDRIESSERPVLYPGNGVRLAGAYDSFQKLVNVLGIPVVTGVSSVDMMVYDHPLYCGRAGTTGDRAGNFAMQNSDVFFSVGARLGFMVTGFNYQTWARKAFTILNDIDENELKKPSLHVSLPVACDAAELIEALLKEAAGRGASPEKPVFKGERADAWRAQANAWKKRYPVVSEKNYQDKNNCTNIYAFYDVLSETLPEDTLIQVSVGTSRVAGSQTFRVKKGQRFITNPNTAAMGFDLPAATGVSVAAGGSEVICVTGEGSLQMNIQELQTIRQNRLPIKIFVINNEGYHSIRQTQRNYFGEPLVGVGEESGDLSFPDLSKLAPVYGFAYQACHASADLKKVIENALQTKGGVISEIFVSKEQITEPKAASKKLPDGNMVSAPLEDMYPFLPKEEMEENMYI